MSLQQPANNGGIQPRRTVQNVTAYVPPLEGRRDHIRLDFNENTTGFPEALTGQESCGELAEDEARALLTVYPEYDDFITVVSNTFNLPGQYLLCTNGSDEALSVAAMTFIEPGEDSALTMSPTFGLIPHNLRLAGADLTELPYGEAFLYEPDRIETELSSRPYKMAIFATPDNPVGALLPKEAVRNFCQKFPDTLFVIDEAYAEYAEQSALSLVTEFSNLIVTRTFSKAWGLAGLRLGILAGCPALLDYVKRVRSPYSVNTLAVKTATTLMARKEEVLAAARNTMQIKHSVLTEVRRRGYRVIPGSANFFMIEVGPDSKGFAQFLRGCGILVRDQSSRPGLAGMVRVSVGTQDEMTQFIAALDSLRQKRVLVFDLDGTLVDTRESFDATVDQLVKKYTGQPLEAGQLDALRLEGGFNDDWEATVELLRRRGVSKAIDDIAAEAQAIYLELAPLTEKWIINSEILVRLKKRYRLGVATGRYRPEFDTIWKERFEPLFDIVICQDDDLEWEKKPSPHILHEAVKAMGAISGLYIGNSVDDMRAAKAAGMMAVGVTFSHPAEAMRNAGADWTIDSFEEFERHLLHCDATDEPPTDTTPLHNPTETEVLL